MVLDLMGQWTTLEGSSNECKGHSAPSRREENDSREKSPNSSSKSRPIPARETSHDAAGDFLSYFWRGFGVINWQRKSAVKT